MKLWMIEKSVLAASALMIPGGVVAIPAIKDDVTLHQATGSGELLILALVVFGTTAASGLARLFFGRRSDYLIAHSIASMLLTLYLVIVFAGRLDEMGRYEPTTIGFGAVGFSDSSLLILVAAAVAIVSSPSWSIELETAPKSRTTGWMSRFERRVNGEEGST